MEASLKPAVNLAKRLKAFDANKEADLKSMIYVSLWGNRADLSIWAAEDAEKAAGEYESENEDEDKKALLTDDSNALCAYLLSGELKDKSVSLIVDNAGFELVCDLALADALTAVCNKVVLRVKAHPTFVSDATFEDIWEHVEFLESASIRGKNSKEERKGRTSRLEEKWRLMEKPFVERSMGDRTGFRVVPATTFWDLPELAQASLSSELNNTGLTIIKGDATISDCSAIDCSTTRKMRLRTLWRIFRHQWLL